jgi:ribonuclease E
MKIDIITDNSLIIPEYIIDLKNRTNKTIELVEHHEKLKNLELQIKEDKIVEKKDAKKFHKKKFKKKPYFKKKFIKKPAAIK